MHQNGVNVRYLGKVADQLQKEENLDHVKYLIERELVVRAMKHIVNKHIRDCDQPQLVPALVAHLLNCLLAPKDFLKRMDESKITFAAQTVKNISDEQISS